MQRNNFIFRKEWRDVAKDLPSDIKAEIYEAIIEYGFSGETPTLSDSSSVAFKFIKEMMDKDYEAYMERCERNRVNGSKSLGRPRKEKPTETQHNPQKPKKPSGLLEEKSLFPSDKETPPTPPIEINNPIIPKEEGSALTGLSKPSLDSDNNASVCEDIVRFYNDTVRKTSVSKCVAITEKRKHAIKLRIKEFGIDKVKEAITITASSSFCNGHNDRNWIADFDFVFNANKMAKILEGKFTDKTTPPLTDDDKQFNAWFNHKFMRVSKMKETLTREQFMSIKNMGYTDDDIIRKLSYMENRSDIYKYVSTYQLLKNWLV